MRLKNEKIGHFEKKVRKYKGVTQSDLALTSGTGLRFVSDLENGKSTCEIGKVLTVLQTLGVKIELTLPHTTVRV